MIMQNIVDAIEQLKKKTDKNLLALETGTIRSYHEKHYSTLHIAEALGGKEGEPLSGGLISIDINPESIRISKDICKDLTNIIWVEGDSLAKIEDALEQAASGSSSPLSFVLLDSVNDGDHIFKEFLLVVPYMKPEGILIIDDSGVDLSGEKLDPQNPHQKKGVDVWKFLTDNNIPFQMKKIPSGRGNNIILTITEELKTAVHGR